MKGVKINETFSFVLAGVWTGVVPGQGTDSAHVRKQSIGSGIHCMSLVLF